MPTQETKKCAHPACDCQARPGSSYCSAECEKETQRSETTCHCGHPGCH